MAYVVRYAARVEWIPDGGGPVSVPSSQVLKLGTTDFADLTSRAAGNIPAGQPVSVQQVPGGDAPSAANFTTAFNAMATDLIAAMAAGGNLTRVLGFATGGG